MKRRYAFLASLLLLALSGCASYGSSYYRDPYYADAYYSGGHYGDEGYYDQDGYYVPYDGYTDEYYDYGYDEYYDYGYVPLWGLDRYSCGAWYSCSPYWNGYYRRPGSGWSLSFGNHWSWGSWGWYGSHWSPWDDYYYWRPDRNREPDRPRPRHPRAPYREGDSGDGQRSQGGEYLRPAGGAGRIERPTPRPGNRDDEPVGDNRRYVRPATPRPLYREGGRAGTADESGTAAPRPWYGGSDTRVRPATSPRTLQPEPGYQPRNRPPPRAVYGEQAGEPSQPAYRPRSQPQPRPAYREPATGSRPDFQPRPRPEPAYRPVERAETPRNSPPPPRAEARAARAEARESRTGSQNRDSDDER